MRATSAEPRERMLVANIGPAERRKRHRFGVAFLLLGVAAVGVARALDLPLAARAASAAFFFAGFLGIFQARAHTCVALASRGSRDLDVGEERIEQAQELTAVRAQARAVMARTLLATLLSTAGALALR
jgi:hypothetical protein